MQDRYGRHIEYLRLSVTDRCDLRCRYCMPEEGVTSLDHRNILSYEELLRIAHAAATLGVRKIRVTGGEPLVRKGLVDFIHRLAALPGSPEITLTTNGLQLAPQAAALKAAGLSRVNISLDSLKSQRFQEITRRDGLRKVLAGIAAADAAGLTPLKINMVPIAGVNADEIQDFARLTLARPWEVRFIEYMPVGANLGFSQESRFPAAAIVAELGKLGELQPLTRRGPAGPARLYRLAGAQGRIGVIPGVSEHFCSDCNRLRVTAEGRIKPCLFSAEEFDLRELLRTGATHDALCRALSQAVAVKPERHHIGEAGFAPGPRAMHGIGG